MISISTNHEQFQGHTSKTELAKEMLLLSVCFVQNNDKFGISMCHERHLIKWIKTIFLSLFYNYRTFLSVLITSNVVQKISKLPLVDQQVNTQV